MKTKLIIGAAALAFSAGNVNAQNVGIGTSTPVASAKLQIVDANRGLLIPNVSLVAVTNGVTPVATPATGLLVWNTNAGVTGGSGTGYYYWDGAAWVRLLAGLNNDWTLLGNAGTNIATNFMGSTDNVSVAFRTNNLETMRMTNAQRVGIGITTPTTKLEVSSGTADAVYGHSNNVGGYLGYETNFSIGVPAQNLLGAGVWAANPAAGYTSIFAQSSGAATVAANIAYSTVWMATYNYVQNASATFNPAASYNQLNVTSATLGGSQIALRGWSDRGTTAGNPGYTIGVEGLANTQNQDALGVEGISYTNAGLSAGGYFEGLNYAGVSWAYAYVGGTTNGVTARKITGTGTVAEIVPTPNHGRVTLMCPESPEYWYQDYGTVELVNGVAHVELDPILADIIVVDANNPIRAFFTPYNMLNFNGVAIVNQTTTGFDLVELNGGDHTGTLHYQMAVKPKTNYGEGRFPQAPGPSYLKSDKEPASAKAANNPADGREIFHWPADHETYGYDPEEMVPVGEVIPAGPHAGKIKLGNGEYGEGVPAERPGRK